jgi:hypothetical protein
MGKGEVKEFKIEKVDLRRWICGIWIWEIILD